MIVEQILVTGMAVFCYLLVDETTKEAVLVDPAGDFNAIFSRVEKHNATVKYIINTHGHYDHTSGNTHVMGKTGAPLLIHENDRGYIREFKDNETGRFSDTAEPGLKKMQLLKDGDSITFGNSKLWVINTPGHTRGCICLYSNGNLFTGDTLFTEGVGRTDLPDSSEADLVNSLKNKILTLPDDTKIWPGHNYGKRTVSTVAEQKKYYRL
ncbi:MAG TPA: MBL fold metallo-hydrolase [Spirochaetota bacterium]|nr:MBL fold metallo-hydrolase [Spirochaetota bacterium]